MLRQGRDALKKRPIIIIKDKATDYISVAFSFFIRVVDRFKTTKSTLIYKGAIFVVAALFVPLSVLFVVLKKLKQQDGIKQRARTLSLLGALLISLSLLLTTHSSLFTGQAQAATSDQLNFQGRLLDAAGNLVDDGIYNMEFNLYYVSSGGTSQWTEDRLVTNTQGVTVANGYFSIYLGEYDAFSGIDWSEELYLGMTVRGTNNCAWGSCTPADSEMTPRFKLTSVPYAFVSANVASSDVDSADSDDVTIQTGDSTTSGTTGDIIIDVGSGVTGNGNIVVGNSNATAINVGTGTIAQTLNFGTGGTGDKTVTLGSTAGGSTTTLQAGSGGIVLGASSLSRTASGSTTLDLVDGSNTTLAITNSGAGVANLSVDGEVILTTVSGAGLTDCDNATTSKLLWDATGKVFSCGTDQSGGGSGLFTDGGTSTYLTSTTDDLLLGSTTDADGTFFMDVSAGSLRVGSTGTSDIAGSLIIADSNGDTTTISAGDSSGSIALILPNSVGTANQCVKNSGTAGTLTFANCNNGSGGGGEVLLQDAYDDGPTGDQTIILSSTQDSLIFRNPSSSGTDSGYVLNVDQVNTGAVDALRVANIGTGNGQSISLINTAGTQANGLLINRNGSGGTTTTLLGLTNTAGTATNGILFTGTIGTDITTATNRALTITSNGTGAITIGGDTGAKTIGLGTGGTGVKTINIGGTAANVIAIGNTQTGGSLSLGGALTTGTITLGGTTQTGTTTLGRSTASNTINLGNANTTTGNTQTISIGAGTPAGTGKAVITIGNSVAASSLALRAGTGGITLGNGGIANTIQIGNTTGAVAQTINLGNNATASSTSTVVLGSTIGTSTTTIQAGSGGIVLGSSTVSRTASGTTTFDFIDGSNTTLSVTNSGAGVANLTVDGDGNFGTLTGAGLSDCDNATTSKLLWDITSSQFSCGTDQAGGGGTNEFTYVVAASDSTNSATADATADGTSDEDEINTAIDTVSAAGGGTVLLLEGTYTIDGTIDIDSNVTLTGAGGNGSVITIANSLDSNINFISEDSGPTNIEISNLVLDGNEANNAPPSEINGIYLTTLSGGTGTTAVETVNIDNVVIRNFDDRAIYMNSVDNFRISNSTIVNANVTGGVNGDVYFTGSLRGVIDGNKVFGSSHIAFESSATSSDLAFTNNLTQGSSAQGYMIDSNNTTVSGNVSKTDNEGIELRGSYATVTGNTIQDSVGNGIDMSTANDSIITGNTIENAGSAGIGVQGDNVVVSNNQINNSASHGIYVDSLSNDNLVISGNNINSADGVGIYLWESDYSLVDGNSILDSGSHGIYVRSPGFRSTVSNNIIRKAGEVTTSDHGIYISGDNTQVLGNYITDNAGTGYAISITAAADETYLADNQYSGTGADSIDDSGTNTIYASQTRAGDTLQSGSSLLKAYGTKVLTGSIDPTASTTLTGVGTKFLTELQVGDRITVSAETRTVTAIASDTSLTVDTATTDTANDTTPDRLPASLIVKDSSNNIDFIISDQGYVGIGVTAPATLLQVGGEIRSGTDSTAGSLSISDGSSNYATIDVSALAGDYTVSIPTITANDSFCLATAANCSGLGGLQAAYDVGNTITTSGYTAGRDVLFTFTDETTDSDFLIDILTSSTSKFAIQNNGTDAVVYDTTNGFSVPGAGTSSEVLGSGATAAGNQTLVVGNGASASAATSVVLGYNASSTGVDSIVVGPSAAVTGNWSVNISSGSSIGASSVLVGTGATVTGTNFVALGRGVNVEGGGVSIGNSANGSAGVAIGNTSIATGFQSTAIGRSSLADASNTVALGRAATASFNESIAIGSGAVTTAVNQLVVGSNTQEITSVFLGSGVTDATPSGFTLNATGGSGTDIAGANLTVAGGRGTGSGTGGSLIFQTATAGGTGSSLNALTTRLTIDQAGLATFANNVTVSGDLTVSTGSSLILTGSGTLPGSPVDGEIFWDSTNEKLLIYDLTNTQWEVLNGGSSAATFVVSTSSTLNKERADYIADGTADEVEIEAAITAANAAGGGTVYLMEGTYNITSAIDFASNVSLIGSGEGATTLFIPSSTNSAFNILNLSSDSNVTIRDLTINGNESGNTTDNLDGISVSADSANVNIENVTSINNGSDGFSLAGIGGLVTNSTANSNLDRGILVSGNENYIDGMQTATNTNEGAEISGDYVTYTNGYSDVEGDSAGGSIALSGSRSIVSNTKIFDSDGRGILLTGNNNSITDNIIVDSFSSGISASDTSDYSSIVGNTFEGNSYGIAFAGSNSTVSGNTIDTTTNDGIYISTNNYFSVINGNTISNAGRHGINAVGTTGDNTISNNSIDEYDADDNGIEINSSSARNSITGNFINDTTGTGYGIDLNSSSDNYLSNNILKGSGADSINDTGSNNIYGNQLSGAITDTSANLQLQAPSSGDIELLSDTDVTGTLTVSGLVTGNAGLTVTGAAVYINDSSNFDVSIAGGTSTGTVNIGTGTGVQVLNFGTGGSGAKTVTLGSTASTGATVLQSGSGNITLQVVDSSTIGTVQIGAGGAGTATPDFLGLDVKSTTGDPAGGANGYIYYNEFDDKFRCYENGAWTDCIGAGGSGANTALSNIASTELSAALNKTSGDVALTTTTSGNITLTPAVSGGLVNVLTGNLQVGNGTPTITLDGEDVYFEGTLEVDGTAYFDGALTVATGSTFTNASSTLFTAIAISDKAAGGDIGSAGTTVDVATTFNVNQTTASQTLTLPNPTVTTSGRIAYVNNVGSTPFTMYSQTITNGDSATFIWNGSNWRPAYIAGAGGGGAFTTSGGLTELSTSTDNVTLGSSTAAGKLFIDGDANEVQLQVEISSSLAVQTSDILQVRTNGASTGDIFVIDEDGKVGIQVANPGAFLNIKGSTTALASLRIDSGVAPTTPGEGDIYYDGTDLFLYDGDIWVNFTDTPTPTVTLQDAYGATSGNTINTTSGRDIQFVLSDDATDSNFDIDIVGTNTVSISRTAGGTGFKPDQLLLLENLKSSITVDNALTVNAVGTITDGIDLSDDDIVNAINIGANTLLGTTSVIDFTNFDLAGDGTATFATTTDSSSTFKIQDAGGQAYLVVDTDSTTTGLAVRIGSGTDDVVLQVDNFSADPSVVTNGGIWYDTDTNQFKCGINGVWEACNSSGIASERITLVPEYPGAVLTPDGGTNVGSMSSDFCSGSSRKSINTGVCGATEEHNYMSWTSASGTNDYDIYIRYQMPSDFNGFSSATSINAFGWRTDGTNNTLDLSLYNAAGNECGTTTNIATGTATWTETALTGDETALANCTAIAADDIVIFKIHMVADTGDYVRSGEIRFTYDK